jgi:hypothetical protein
MQLQKAAQGLLGWFSLKTTGRNPPVFGESLLPVVEMGDNYLLQGELSAENVLGTNIGIGSSSGQITFQVPANKVYRVLAIGADLALAAADNAFTTDWYIFVNFAAPSSLTGYIFAGAMQASAAGNARIGAFYLPRPLLLPPSASIVVGFRSSANLTVAASNHGSLIRQSIDL